MHRVEVTSASRMGSMGGLVTYGGGIVRVSESVGCVSGVHGCACGVYECVVYGCV